MKIESGLSYYFSARNAGDSSKNAEHGSDSFMDLIGKRKESASTGEPETYDFTNITSGDLLETVNGLIRDGQMDLDETSSLLGFMGNSPLSAVNPNGPVSAKANAAFDVFAKIEEGIMGALSRNETQSAEGLRQAADALRRFQGQLARQNLET